MLATLAFVSVSRQTFTNLLETMWQVDAIIYVCTEKYKEVLHINGRLEMFQMISVFKRCYSGTEHQLNMTRCLSTIGETWMLWQKYPHVLFGSKIHKTFSNISYAHREIDVLMFWFIKCFFVLVFFVIVDRAAEYFQNNTYISFTVTIVMVCIIEIPFF